MAHTFAMENDILMSRDPQLGTGFVPSQYLGPGENEYRIRDAQLKAGGVDPRTFRKLRPFELETLVLNQNTCSDWSTFLVSEPFTPELLHGNAFAGLVRIGPLERVSLEHHDLQLSAGISNSRIIACDIGANCVISNCSYIAHYIIGANCILIDNAEIHVSNHSKFGSGCVVEGEGPELRITIDVMNEAGGRGIYPFEGMNCADAYLWARYRDRSELMSRFEAMTDASFDSRRGKYGTIGSASVLKSNGVIKDVAVGESAYIKGANKLKNLRINSKETARTQIGEGVELVNGIIGYGCKVFYGSKAVRFVMCDNSALKYGARLIHSVLGENSTVSCCELLNNLIFPAHEQHHNTSFLIASLVKGQSNMAAGATIGSNHNSRSPDGEIEAGRGFWPGLCTSVKHSSRFASFCLLAKGDYRYELDVPFPFCLVDNDYAANRLLLSPAYWWTGNTYALMRNEAKFKSRDNRADKSLKLEFSPFAPDTAAEILSALALLEELTGLAATGEERGAREAGMSILASSVDPLPFEVKAPGVEHSSRDCVLRKPARAWKAYREMLLWFAGNEVLARASSLPEGDGGLGAIADALEQEEALPIEEGWENLGGLLVPASRLAELLDRTETGAYPTWEALHGAYRELSASYSCDRLRCAWSTLGYLYPLPGRRGPSAEGLASAFRDLAALGAFVEAAVYESRAKDWTNPFRKATFRSEAEMTAVLGRPEDNGFVRKTRAEMEELRAKVRSLVGP
jgi:NDP-sugar pyrophosphorylase family protein